MSLSPLTQHYIPAVNKGMTAGDKIMVVLHGRGDSLHSYKTFAQELNVTGLNYLLLNAPFVEAFGYTWYDDSFSTDDLRYQKSQELLNQLINELVKKHDSRDIFLFGFSQGGRMALDLFIHQNKEFAGVVALSPRVTKHEEALYEQLNEKACKTPLFLAHGQYDPIIPIRETQEHLAPLMHRCQQNVFHSYPMSHEIDIFEIQELRTWMNEYL